MNTFRDEWLPDEPRVAFPPLETRLPAPGTRRPGHQAADDLTAREWEVVEHLAAGRC
ncbi:MAG: hypothetical protein ACYDC1_21225 [Limisphaerales bacterium]